MVCTPDFRYWVVILVTPVLRVLISLFPFHIASLIVHTAKIKATSADLGPNKKDVIQ